MTDIHKLAEKIVKDIEHGKIPGYIRDDWLIRMEHVDDHISDEQADRLVAERHSKAVEHIAKLISKVVEKK